MPRSTARLTLAALVLLVMCVSGCSRFHGAWKRAAEAPAPTSGLEGRWEGVWVSDHNGHHGRLRCLVTHQSNGVYQAWFHAKFQKIFSFAYKVPIQVEATADGYRFHGQEDLGTMAGGLYTYDGSVEGTNFFSTYKAKYDYGTFRMGRPAPSDP